MSEFIDMLLTVLASFLGALIAWWSWGHIHQLFPMLPLEWHELTFMQTFCLVWLWRLAGGILRAPNIKIDKEKLKVK